MSGAGLSNITALASDGSTITASGVTLINSPDTIASTTSTYINGLFVEHRLSVELPTSILENMTGGLEVLPSVSADEFYEITRGYARLNGLAATSGHKIEIETSVDGHSIMKIPAA